MRHIQRSGGTAVLLVPDSTQRAAVVEVLHCGGIEVVAATSTLDGATALLEEHHPDVFVVDVDLPEGNRAAFRLIAGGVRAQPKLAVVALADRAGRGLIDDALATGVAAFVLKRTRRSLGLAAGLAITSLDGRAQGLLPRAKAADAAVAAVAAVGPRLTRRELEILRLVSEGRSNRAVGQLLWVSDQTVKFHLANIYRKLGVGSRYQAAQAAHEHGLLDPVATNGSGAGATAATLTHRPGTSP
jgi:DNA-binding NarL/FixJ family response regulator